jgi:hypothetical protein
MPIRWMDAYIDALIICIHTMMNGGIYCRESDDVAYPEQSERGGTPGWCVVGGGS